MCTQLELGCQGWDGHMHMYGPPHSIDPGTEKEGTSQGLGAFFITPVYSDLDLWTI